MSTNFATMDDDVRSDRIFRDWLLFMLTVSSGAVDAISFLALAACRTDVFVVRQPLWFGRSMLTWEA
jgi:hypothetical protein